MNPTDILGDILRGGAGGGVFKDIFGGGAKPRPRRQSGTTTARPEEIERDARDLEDMLGVGEQRGGERGGRSWPAERRDPSERSGFPPALPGRRSGGRPDPERQDAEAVILLRAMVSAAKADGRISADEQRSIVDRAGGSSREAADFLRREFERPVDVREFAWSVPLGLEYKVYMVSLAAIDLDTRAESEYLRELAHGLRLPAEVCDHIHQRYGVRPLS